MVEDVVGEALGAVTETSNIALIRLMNKRLTRPDYPAEVEELTSTSADDIASMDHRQWPTPSKDLLQPPSVQPAHKSLQYCRGRIKTCNQMPKAATTRCILDSKVLISPDQTITSRERTQWLKHSTWMS